MINESQPVKTEEENEFKLKENQERFFSAKRDHIQKCLEHEDSESLAKTAIFLLNQLESAQKANESLKSINAMLLPTAAHPFMDPAEMKLWPYDCLDIYETYDRIFNCKGHGWANLQSTHINLSFNGDEEFGKLHGAIRALLPLIPAIAASSPFLDSKYCGFLDGRIETYRHNQEKIPSITGKVIPEAVFTYKDYEEQIFNRVKADIAPYDPEHLLNHFFLNSRGAIARFDRGACENSARHHTFRRKNGNKRPRLPENLGY
ncbi:glutamate-cysteine ligase family protein [Fibrobacter succinogenes]|uniref:glutamate-cysteine ligase family protein n=1 Tax=Fibrobacter succinogenes TaxID=833 RepID=UPI0026EE07FB|nr:glutamate-cysteine ligase family protein [Fibrobacter succinogenes]